MSTNCNKNSTTFKTLSEVGRLLESFNVGSAKVGEVFNSLTEAQQKLVLSGNLLTEQQKRIIVGNTNLSMSEAGVITTTEGVVLSEEKATVSTFSLSSAFKGLAASLGITTTALGVITGALAAVAVGAIAYKKWAEYQEELRQSAVDASNTLTEQTKSVESYVERYKELQVALKNAKGDEQAVYSIKQDLLTLQNELNDTFGEEYGKLNLVTDAYKDQTEVIKQYNKELAQSYLNENESAINTAKSKMESNNHYNLTYTGEILNSDRGAILKEIAESYKDRGVSILDELGDGSYAQFSIHLNANAEDAQDVINDFMNDVREKAIELNDEDLFADVLEISSMSLNESKNIINEYGDIYKKALLSEIATNDGLSNGYNQITQAVESYNEAILKSEDPYNDDNVKNAWNNLQTVKQGIEENVDVWGKYESVTTEAFEQANDSAYSFYQTMQNDDSISKLTDDLRGLSNTDLESMANDGVEDSFDKLCKAANDYGLEIQDVIDLLIKLGIIQGQIADESQNQDETDISSTFTTFKSLWKSIGKGDDDASKAAKSAKEEILKLAEAGKLTEKAFKKSSIADTFTNAGYSIEEATKKINRMVDSSKQLSSLKSSISSIQDAYQEKKDNKVASSSTLAGMEDTFGKLSSWEKYKNILGSTSSTLKECRIAQNELATEFVSSNNFLSQLTSKNKEYYTSQLKELGIANAQSIVENTLKAKKQALANETKALEAATSDLSGETSNASEKFLEQANMTNLARVELVNLIAQQKIFEGQGIDTTTKVEQLNKLAEAYFGVANAIQISTAMGNDPRYYKNPEDYTKAIEEEWNKLISKQTKISIDPVKVSPKNDTKDKSSKSKSKSKSSDTKQEIDWLSRRLTRMQSIIDLTASKLKNLFKIDEKENNIDKQIKQTTKLINQYRHAYDVYMGKANKVAKASGKGKNKVPALSKDIINKIQSGEFTKDSYDKLIKKYGKDYADKINEYIDYYDKAQDSLKNKEEQIANKRELEKSKIQLKIDDAQSKIDRADARIENATSASEKNKILDNEKKYYKELYKQKIEQAKLDKDSVEVEKLKAEKKKQERDLSIEQHQNNIDEKQSALDVLEAQKENVTSASEKNAIIDQELALKREICNEELAIAELNGDQNEQERLKKQLLFEEKKAQLEQIANIKDEFDLRKNALSRDEAKLQQQIAENEAKGVGQSIKDYRKQIALSEERQQELRNEKQYWEAYLAEQIASNKIIADDTDSAYKEVMDTIASCDEGISDCIVNQINWNKAIKEMDYKNYEALLDLLDMAYKKLENLKSIREAHGKELTNDEILKQIKIDDKIINSSKSAMESAKARLREIFSTGEQGLLLGTDSIDEFINYLEYMPEQIPNLMKKFFGDDFDFNKDTYSGIFDEIEKFTTNNDKMVQALVDADGLSDEIGQKVINHANEYLEALKKQKDYKDHIFAIEKAQYDLEKAKNNLTKKVWDGQQWVYTADTEAVQSAQETLDNTMFEEFNNSIQDLIDVLEQFIKDFNIYDDNGNMINNPDVILKKGVLGEYTIADIDKIFTDKVLDISKLSGLMSNIQYAIPNVSIPNINLPDVKSRAMNQTVNYDKIELILPNITDASTGADLAKSFVNELKNLPSYAKQYDWNK